MAITCITRAYRSFHLELFDTEYKVGAQTIYKEFAIRSHWYKIKSQRDADKYCDAIDEAWEEYTSIFKLEWTRVNFPP